MNRDDFLEDGRSRLTGELFINDTKNGSCSAGSIKEASPVDENGISSPVPKNKKDCHTFHTAAHTLYGL